MPCIVRFECLTALSSIVASAFVGIGLLFFVFLGLPRVVVGLGWRITGDGSLTSANFSTSVTSVTISVKKHLHFVLCLTQVQRSVLRLVRSHRHSDLVTKLDHMHPLLAWWSLEQGHPYESWVLLLWCRHCGSTMLRWLKHSQWSIPWRLLHNLPGNLLWFLHPTCPNVPLVWGWILKIQKSVDDWHLVLIRSISHKVSCRCILLADDFASNWPSS